LISQHESLMLDVERQKQETTTELDRGYRQQQIADELLADADAARDTARKAVAKAEDTLREANETLRTLRGTIACRRLNLARGCEFITTYHFKFVKKSHNFNEILKIR